VKRSENVSLVVMGAVAFAATFGGGMAYFAMQKPSHAAQTQSVAGQQCTTRSDGTQDCQPPRRSFAYYLVPRFSGWSWGWGTSSEPVRRDVALSGSRSAYAPTPAGGIVRSGFGSTARSTSIRISAGG
jgi:hypothetical protein